MTNKKIDHGENFDFGRTSENYARFRDIYPPLFYEKIVSRSLCTASQRVLDVGTGTGVLPRNLYRFGADWTATDISENQIEEAKRLSREANMDIDFRVSSAENLDLPKETKLLASVNLLADVALVEKGDVNRSSFVNHGELHKLCTAAGALQAGIVPHQAGDADTLAGLCLGDGHNSAAVLISTGKERNQIKQRKDAEPVEGLRPFFSDPADVADSFGKISHGLFNKPGMILFVHCVWREEINEALGAGDLVVFVDHDHLEAPVCSPVIKRTALTENKHRSGKGIGHGPILTDNRDGEQPVADRPSGAGVDDVVVGVSVIDKEALIAPACDNGGFPDLERPNPGGRIIRILNSDGPFAAVGLDAQSLNIPAERDDPAPDSRLTHGINGVFRGTSFSDRPKADFGPRRERDRIGPRCRIGGENHFVKRAPDNLCRQFLIGGNIVAAVDKPPELDDGIDA